MTMKYNFKDLIQIRSILRYVCMILIFCLQWTMKNGFSNIVTHIYTSIPSVRLYISIYIFYMIIYIFQPKPYFKGPHLWSRHALNRATPKTETDVTQFRRSFNCKNIIWWKTTMSRRTVTVRFPWIADFGLM